MLKNQKGFSLIEIAIVLLVLAVVTFIGIDVFLWHNSKTTKDQTGSNSSTSSTSISNTGDLKTEKDLATLDTAIQNYVNNQECATLPSSLSQLKLSPGKLNYAVTNYQYSNLGADCGGPGDYQFQLCASFQSNTFSSVQSYDFSAADGGSPSGYTIHDKGKQCYTDGGGAYGPSFDIVLDSKETNLMNATCKAKGVDQLNPPDGCESYLAQNS